MGRWLSEEPNNMTARKPDSDISCNTLCVYIYEKQPEAGTHFHISTYIQNQICGLTLKVHKRENFLGSDIEICTFS